MDGIDSFDPNGMYPKLNFIITKEKPGRL